MVTANEVAYNLMPHASWQCNNIREHDSIKLEINSSGRNRCIRI